VTHIYTYSTPGDRFGQGTLSKLLCFDVRLLTLGDKATKFTVGPTADKVGRLSYSSLDTLNMEEDRAQADLGPDFPVDLTTDPDAVEKKPKRRFIGRRAADAKAAAKAQENGGGGIEDSGAVQGALKLLV